MRVSVSGVRQDYVMSLSLFKMYMDAVIRVLKIGMGKKGKNGDFPGLLYADDGRTLFEVYQRILAE